MTQQTQTKQLPNGWKEKPFAEVVEVLDSKRKPINSDEREKRKGNIPYYGATGQVGWIDNFLFNEELVLLGEDAAPFLEPYEDKAYLINGKTWGNNHAHVLKAKSELINKFLLYFLNNFDYHQYVTGTTRLKLNQSRMNVIPIVFPPKETQSLIVSTIETQFTRLDEAVKNLKSVKEKLEIYRKSVLEKDFEKTFGENGKSIKSYCENVRQIVPQKESFKEFYYIDIASIDNKRKLVVEPKIIFSKDAPSRARQETLPGDVVYSSVRTYLRNIALVPELGNKIISTTGKESK